MNDMGAFPEVIDAISLGPMLHSYCLMLLPSLEPGHSGHEDDKSFCQQCAAFVSHRLLFNEDEYVIGKDGCCVRHAKTGIPVKVARDHLGLSPLEYTKTMSDSVPIVDRTAAARWREGSKGPQNGRDIIRVGSSGKRWFAIGERSPFLIDAVWTYSQWLEIDRAFRDDKGEIGRENIASLNAEAIRFVQAVAGKDEQPDTTIDMGEALGFLTALANVNTEMQPFFVPKPSAAPSSAESTPVTFSASDP